MDLDLKTFFRCRKGISENLTSHDLLKSLALLLMIVDHVGYFFFPEESWFRVIGRLSVPIWFFLIGYADKRHVQSGIWIGALLIVLSTLFAGEFVFPLNILFMLALARLWVDRIMARALQSYEAFAGMFFLLFFLSFPTMLLFEYGTMGVMFTVFGYLRRHKEALTIKPVALFGFLGGIYVFYAVVSSLLIAKLDASQALFLFDGVFLLMIILFIFKPYEFKSFPKQFDVLLKPFKIMGRHTLLIYVFHLIVLRGVMLVLGDERFGIFEAEIMPPAFLQIIHGFIG